MSSRGQKITSDRNASEIAEKPGAIASDSLAAESQREGAGFSPNADSEPLGVSGSHSTLANTDTSGARKLNAASDADQRRSREDGAKENKYGAAAVSYPNSMGGQDKGVAVQNTDFHRNDGSYQANTAGGASAANSNPAPTYVNTQGANDSANPKGKNLKEGLFSSDPKNNASFRSDIGSKDDPGRLAESKFQKEAAETAVEGGVPNKKTVASDNYGVLGNNVQV